MKIKLKILLRHIALYLGNRPALRRAAVGILAHFPAQRHRLRTILSVGEGVSSPDQLRGISTKHLSPRGQQIYKQLKAGIQGQIGK